MIVLAIFPSSMQWAVICCGCMDRSLLRLPPSVLWAQLSVFVAERVNHGVLCF